MLRLARHTNRTLLVASLAIGAIVWSRPASADVISGDSRPLDTTESYRMAFLGETVVREQSFDRGDHHYVGGLTYTVLDTHAGEIAAAFDDVEAYRKVLPKTKSARVIGRQGQDVLVEVVQGNSLVEATHTIRVRRSGNELRFWLDRSFPHEADDVWGFFRLEPFATSSGEQRVLLTYGILVDMGSGLVRELFGNRVRAAMLTVPQRLRFHLAESRRRAGAP